MLNLPSSFHASLLPSSAPLHNSTPPFFVLFLARVAQAKDAWYSVTTGGLRQEELFFDQICILKNVRADSEIYN